MPMMPMMPGLPMFSWVFLFIFLAFILVFVFAVLPQIRKSLQNESRPKKNSKAKQSSVVEVPEELRKKAREMVEEIDWNIRLLEGQLETEKDKEERKRLQREIEEKRRQYRSIVDRFGW